MERKKAGTHPVDEGISLEQITLQFGVYWELARFFHRKGMNVQVREEFQGKPRFFLD